MKEKEVPQVRITKTFESLKCLFAQQELLSLGNEMARAYSRKNQAEADMKASAMEFKNDIAEASAVIQKLASKISNGYEFRNVDCEIEHDFGANTVRIRRLDTGEVIRERAMTGEERQMEISLPEKKKQEETKPTPAFEEKAPSSPFDDLGGTKPTPTNPDDEAADGN